MRLDEIAQLRICDLRQDEDTKHWFFDIDRTGGRSTKNVSSIRHVPLHRDLKRIGLLTLNAPADHSYRPPFLEWRHPYNKTEQSPPIQLWDGRHPLPGLRQSTPQVAI
ncbi:hypothetical protein EAS61_39660 [Bradyrhizobium zhanjiangense]|uniref:Tyr recombinase domain-containing protein n=1 Tax=Bradyrhizobium zhanjiangense TaxID=1325107 RepID=A0A4Q0Q5Y8_9BRAD|nr:hypothetical protein EAS61_39660 [Bradyrhizobium zhanjiangense]